MCDTNTIEPSEPSKSALLRSSGASISVTNTPQPTLDDSESLYHWSSPKYSPASPPYHYTRLDSSDDKNQTGSDDESFDNFVQIEKVCGALELVSLTIEEQAYELRVKVERYRDIKGICQREMQQTLEIVKTDASLLSRNGFVLSEGSMDGAVLLANKSLNLVHIKQTYRQGVGRILGDAANLKRDIEESIHRLQEHHQDLRRLHEALG